MQDDDPISLSPDAQRDFIRMIDSDDEPPESLKRAYEQVLEQRRGHTTTGMKSAYQWVDEGVPMPSGKPDDRDRYVRWVAMIQEDAVSCYSFTEAVTAVEKAAAEVEAGASFDILRAAIAALSSLKAKTEE